MSLGVRYYIGEIHKGDTAELYAALREREGVVPQEDIASVEFTVQRPNGTVEAPVQGEVEDDGQGYYQYPGTLTTEAGEYLVQAQFTLMSGEIRSVMVNFVVENPFAAVTEKQLVAEEVWLRLEDCFDSTEGGPVLRDYTLAHFDQKKIESFIPEVLLEINVQMPPSGSTLSEFATPQANGEVNPLMPLISKGVLCKAIQHLIRSYVEQPVPQGAQIAYEDRTRYAQAWQAVYQIEYKDWMNMVRLYKRQALNLGHSALLVGSKAGRLFFSGNILRSRNIGRGFF